MSRDDTGIPLFRVLSPLGGKRGGCSGSEAPEQVVCPRAPRPVHRRNSIHVRACRPERSPLPPPLTVGPWYVKGSADLPRRRWVLARDTNAFSERVIGTIRRGCTDHIIFHDERHAECVLAEYLAYYHARPHRSLRLQPRDGARHLAPPRPLPGARIVATPILGGLHHRYGFRPLLGHHPRRSSGPHDPDDLFAADKTSGPPSPSSTTTRASRSSGRRKPDPAVMFGACARSLESSSSRPTLSCAGTGWPSGASGLGHIQPPTKVVSPRFAAALLLAPVDGLMRRDVLTNGPAPMKKCGAA